MYKMLFLPIFEPQLQRLAKTFGNISGLNKHLKQFWLTKTQ